MIRRDHLVEAESNAGETITQTETEAENLEIKGPQVTKRSKLILLSVILLIPFLASCSKGEEYFFYKHIKGRNWYNDTLLVYELDSIPFNPKQKYNIRVELSTTAIYPYRDLWLQLTHSFTDTTTIQTDTLKYQLADEFGRWYGNGVGGINQLTLKYLEGVTLDSAKAYQLSIAHLMKDNPLKGVDKLGLRITEVK